MEKKPCSCGPSGGRVWLWQTWSVPPKKGEATDVFIIYLMVYQDFFFSFCRIRFGRVRQ